jgi:hypothetical protein
VAAGLSPLVSFGGESCAAAGLDPWESSINVRAIAIRLMGTPLSSDMIPRTLLRAQKKRCGVATQQEEFLIPGRLRV